MKQGLFKWWKCSLQANCTYQNSKYQNSDRIHCKCVLHIKNIAKILDILAKCSTYEKMSKE